MIPLKEPIRQYANISNTIKEGMTREDMLSFSKIDKSVSMDFFLPFFMKKLDNVQITSAKLARIYFSGWDASFNSNSVVPSIYEGVYLNFLNESFSDEFGEVFFSAFEKGYLSEELLRDIVDKGVSPFFDDISTQETREDRDKIFDKAFLKTIRLNIHQLVLTLKIMRHHLEDFMCPVIKVQSMRVIINTIKMILCLMFRIILH